MNYLGVEDAIKVIRNECKKHEGCEDCPLRYPSGERKCMVQAAPPEKWILKSDPTPDDANNCIFARM